MEPIRFILLMRHAKHTHGKPEEADARGLKAITDLLGKLVRMLISPECRVETRADVLTIAGRDETAEVAARLKEETTTRGGELKLAGILVADSPEAAATAGVVMAMLGHNKSTPFGILNPCMGKKISQSSSGVDLTEQLKHEVEKKVQTVAKEGGSGNAVLLVGHQPMLGWISNALVDEPHAQVNSEILCLDLEKRRPPVLRWVISPSDDKTLEDLREKIRKKMELAGTLGGFITAGIGFVIGTLAEREKAAVFEEHLVMTLLAIGCLFCAVVFYLRTMFSYDSLLMPKRFWSETVAGVNNRPRWIVARPPSPAHWILYQNMIRVWRWQFMPATLLALYGLFLLGGAVVLGFLQAPTDGVTLPGAVMVSAPLLVGVAVLGRKAKKLIKAVNAAWKGFIRCPGPGSRFRYLFGPWLGSED